MKMLNIKLNKIQILNIEKSKRRKNEINKNNEWENTVIYKI